MFCWFEGVRYQGQLIACSGEISECVYSHFPRSVVIGLCVTHLAFFKGKFKKKEE